MSNSIVLPRLSEVFKRTPKERTVPWTAWKHAVLGIEFWKARYQAATGNTADHDAELVYMGTDADSGDRIFVLKKKPETA